MTNKIKLLLWSFLLIFSIFSTATAVEFYGDKNTEQIVSSYNWYTLEFAENSAGYLWCIWEKYKQNANIKSKQFCEDAVYDIYSYSSYSSVLWHNSYILVSDGTFRLLQKVDSNDVFWLRYFNIDGKKQYYRLWIKNIWAKSVKLNSKRGSAVYSSAFMDWIWFSLTKKDWDQVKVSQVVNNVFALDGFLVVAKTSESYLLDTYTNKMYKYTDPLYPNGRYARGQVESIFPRIRDNVPSQVSDIQRWPLGDYKMYYNQSEFKSFDLKNTREATESDLNEIRENIKKSLVVFNQEALKLYWDIDWLDLSVWDSSDLPKNNNENTGNTVVKNATREEKKSCVAYYTYMRSMSSHSDWCLWEVNKDMSDSRLDYWWAISTDWDLSKFGVWDKTKYRRCWHWNNYKEGVKKSLWDKWPAFWKDRQTNYIATEAKDIDVNALCSHIVLSPSEKLAEAKDNSSIWKKIAWIWNGNSGDPLSVDWSWNALYQNDFQNELRDLQPYYWQCQSYDKYWLKKISISENERSNACKLYEKKKKKLIEKWKWVELEYTNDSTVEWQIKLLEKRLWSGKGMLESVWSGVSNTLSEWWEVLFKTVKDPFYSGYNAIIPLQCNNSYRIEFMDIFLYALFWIIVFILFRSL